MTAREQGLTQSVAATIAGFSERSGRRIETGEHQPKYGNERHWRTREDPFASVWDSELRPKLEREPQLEPTTLYEDLLERYPGQFEGTLRSINHRHAGNAGIATLVGHREPARNVHGYRSDRATLPLP